MRFQELDQTLQASRLHVHTYSLYPIDDAPADCPWQWSETGRLSLPNYMASLFEPLHSGLPGVAELLTFYGKDLACLSTSGSWFLIYILASPATGARCFLMGGMPSSSASPPQAVEEAHWHVPEELSFLYRVHDGFGMVAPLGLFWSDDAVVPARRLALLSDYFPDGSDHPNSPYSLKDLLMFFPDGAGNGQCFYRPYLGIEEPTVDWDHETGEISRREDFWTFVDRKLVALINQKLKP
jgi:hypothetical protein